MSLMIMRGERKGLLLRKGPALIHPHGGVTTHALEIMTLVTIGTETTIMVLEGIHAIEMPLLPATIATSL